MLTRNQNPEPYIGISGVPDQESFDDLSETFKYLEQTRLFISTPTCHIDNLSLLTQLEQRNDACVPVTHISFAGRALTLNAVDTIHQYVSSTIIQLNDLETYSLECLRKLAASYRIVLPYNTVTAHTFKNASLCEFVREGGHFVLIDDSCGKGIALNDTRVTAGNIIYLLTHGISRIGVAGGLGADKNSLVPYTALLQTLDLTINTDAESGLRDSGGFNVVHAKQYVSAVMHRMVLKLSV